MVQLFKASLATSSPRGQLVKCFTTKFTDIFVEKVREAFAMVIILTFEN